MKTGVVIKSKDEFVSDNELELINTYTKREFTKDEIYAFSVVLCDNDIDRDFERFTVESLYELEKLFVGKTGIFDHEAKSKNQTARIFSCKVEKIEGKKTKTGEDYYRLVARAYLPKSEKNSDLILSLESGILKEVSVGCAVRKTRCSVCKGDINSLSCNHTKGSTYNNTLCYGELCDVFDAYEFSFVAIPAQKNAGVIKAFSDTKKELKNMNNLLKKVENGEELTLKSCETKALYEYINELKSLAKDGMYYKETLKSETLSKMSAQLEGVAMDTLKGIVKKLSVSELLELKEAYSKKCDREDEPQLIIRDSKDKENKSYENFQFTI